MKKQSECKHPDFWFDRTLSYCSFCDDEQMDSVCTKCGKTTCQIAAEKSKRD